VKAYYERRAREYDDWYLGGGRFADRNRPGWNEELDTLRQTLEALRPVRTLDVACGTGFLTRHLPGEIVGLDQSEAMLAEARAQAPDASYVRGEALELPFPDGSFDRVFTASFYGHLEDADRETFLREARRVAPEAVVADAALRPDVDPEEQQERILNDGSRWQVYKRYFEPEQLSRELGGGRILHAGRWFVVVQA
jgi:demethylmenaquinone methyltransferase/2-methoxy-6-polyprenyl-1,4-benzoquinol methylase